MKLTTRIAAMSNLSGSVRTDQVGATTAPVVLRDAKGSGAPSGGRVRVAVVAALLALAALVFGAAPALAAPQWNLQATFAKGHASGRQLAVDYSSGPTAGDIYVTGAANAGELSRYTAAHAAAGQSDPDAQITTGFGQSYGVAVDPATGNVYADDYANSNVVKSFDSLGNLTSFSSDPSAVPLLVQPGAIAINPTTGNILIGNDYIGPSRVVEFDPDGKSTGKLYETPGPVKGVAVDTAGNVYVALGAAGTIKFTAPGSTYTTVTDDNSLGIAINPVDNHLFINGSEGAAEYSPAGVRLSDFFGPGGGGVGVDQDGTHVYLAGSTSAGIYTASQVSDAESKPVTALSRTSATLNAHIDPAGAGDISDCVFEYISDADFKLPDPDATEVDQLTIAATGGTFVLLFNGQESAPIAFDAAPATVGAALEGFAGVGSGNVSVEGGPGDESGASPYTITFTGALADRNVPDLGADGTALTGPAPAANAETIAQGHGKGFGEAVRVPCSEGTAFNAPADVSAEISGLTLHTIYRFRVAVTGPNGTKHSVDQTFQTLSIAEVETGEVTDLQPTTATLGGTLDPLGANTTYHYQYISDALYHEPFCGGGLGFCSSFVPVPDADAGSAPGQQSVPIPISGLSANTLYHYRLVATNSFGTENGEEKTFTTLTALKLDPAPASDITGSSVTLNATLNPRGSEVAECRFEYVLAGTANRVQTLTLTGTLSGALTLSYKGKRTQPIALLGAGPTPAQLQSALAALPAIGSEAGVDNVQVTGPAGGPYRIEFVGALASTDIQPLAAEATGGTVNASLKSVEGEQWQGAASASCAGDLSSIPADFNPHPVSAGITDLLGHHAYHFRLLASNGNGSVISGRGEFETAPVAPAAITGPALTPGPDSVQLTGSVNPFGTQSRFYFEYGLTSAYRSRSSEGVLGDGVDDLSVSRVIGDLQPSTEYHYRLVSVNAIGVHEGADRTFVTDSPISPSGRAYEQVSPVEKGGTPVKSRLLQRNFYGVHAAADGNSVTFATPASLPNAKSLVAEPLYLATRSPSAWNASDPSLPLDDLVYQPRAIFRSVVALTEDQRYAVVLSGRKLTQDAVAGYGNLYRVDTDTGAAELLAAPPVTNFSEVEGFGYFYGMSPDARTLIFSEGPVTLLTTNSPILAARLGQPTRIVSVRPDGTSGPPPRVAVSPFARGPAGVDVHQVSRDGTMVYWRSGGLGNTDEEVFLRINATESQSAVGVAPAANGDFSKGSSVVTNVHTTEGTFVSGAEVFSSVLPANTIIKSVGQDTLTLSRASSASLSGASITSTPPCLEPSKGCTVRLPGSSFVAASPDGRLALLDDSTGPLVYDADNRSATRLASMPMEEREAVFSAGGISRIHDPEVRAVGDGLGATELKEAALKASPNGRYVALLAKGQAYLYDTQSKELACASCRRDGGPVLGGALGGVDESVAGDHWIPRFVTDDGTVFFTTREPLVSADVNGTFDVYSFRAGDATLISPGVGPASEFQEISADGSDVFFTTAAGLVAQDTDGIRDLYDARLGGGIASQNVVSAPECVGADCRTSAVPAPPTPTVGSKSVSGPGNRSTRKHKHRSKNKPHTKKHKKAHKRSGPGRGGSK